MILYHGSYMAIEKPMIITQEKGRDFGFGFYTTTIKLQQNDGQSARLGFALGGRIKMKMPL